VIRHPSDGDLPELTSLWQEAFGDSQEETSFYFQYRHRHGNMLVKELDGGIAGMLSMLPVTLTAPGLSLPGRYVFAVATKREQRGQGVSTELLHAAHETMRREGAAVSLLVPADAGLFHFYRKRGYQDQFFINEFSIKAKEILPMPAAGEARRCTAEEYTFLRSAVFSQSRLFVKWDIEALEYVRLGAEASGGAMLMMSGGSGQAAAVCEPRYGAMRVSELILDGLSWQEALAMIHRHFNAERYVVRVPEGLRGHDSRKYFGMAKWLTEPPQTEGGPPWLALAKD